MARTADRPLRWGSWAALVASSVLGVATAVYWSTVGLRGLPLAWGDVLLAGAGSAAGAASALGLLRSASSGRLTAGRLCVCTVGLAFAMLASTVWFRGPMHDIALALGSHGRWGCVTVDDGGGAVYLVRSETAPFLLFCPVIGLIAWRGLIVARRG